MALVLENLFHRINPVGFTELSVVRVLAISRAHLCLGQIFARSSQFSAGSLGLPIYLADGPAYQGPRSCKEVPRSTIAAAAELELSAQGLKQ